MNTLPTANPIPTPTTPTAGGVWLHATLASELMTADPVSLQPEATLREAAAVLLDGGFSAAPVVDALGRPLGVLSRSDIVRFLRERPLAAGGIHQRSGEGRLQVPSELVGVDFHIEFADDDATVAELMTPVVLAVAPQASAREVIGTMLLHEVHRVFVVDAERVVGVISPTDLLRRLG